MITHAPNAVEGKVAALPSFTAATFTRGSAILCRNSAPLVSLAYGLIARDVPCIILGRDIGEKLVSLVKKMMATNIPDLLARLDNWRERETSLAMQRGADPSTIEDQHAAIVVIVQSQDENARTIADLCARISLLFSDENVKSKVVLSTIHKAKGEEWDKVFLLDWGLIPSKYATQTWQKRQERNLQYVAITRTKNELYYINSNTWKE